MKRSVVALLLVTACRVILSLPEAVFAQTDSAQLPTTEIKCRILATQLRLWRASSQKVRRSVTPQWGLCC
jgi:hypothetical protein